MDSNDQERGQRGRQESTEQQHPDDRSCSSNTALMSGLRSAAARFLVPPCFGVSPSSGLPVLSPPPPPPTKVYHVWPGKNVFFFDGRVICGPDPRGLLVTATAVLISEWVFLTDNVDPSSKRSILMAAFSITLAATVMFVLLLTATRDPGIIPRNQTTSPPGGGAGGARAGIRRSRSRRIVVIVNGVETRQKYCGVCRIFRPPRSSHCAVCDNCVARFDHHCPWLGQCVGQSNYRMYLLLVSLALAFYAYTLAFCAMGIWVKLEAAGAGILSLLRTTPQAVALPAFSFVAVCSLAGLLLFHAILVAKNQTSREKYKGWHRGSPNPYSKGVLKNVRECLFDRLPPPNVDFRAMASSAGTAVSSTSSFSAAGGGTGRR